MSDTINIHIDEVHNIVDEILKPLYPRESLMYEVFLAIKKSGRLGEIDESWREDLNELRDPTDWVENVVRGHVYDAIMECNPGEETRYDQET